MSAVAAASPPAEARTRALRQLLRSVGLWIGLVVVVAMVVMALAAPWLAPYDPNEQNVVAALQPPSAEYWFGTDFYGRDVLSRIIWGARVSLTVGVVATLIGVAAGTAIGLASGYFGGWFDRAVIAATDVLLSFPQLIMGLLLVAVLGPSLGNLILAIAITAVPAFVRVARGSTLALREREFVDACRAMGCSGPRIMLRHVLPNILDEVVVLASLWLATAIRTESTAGPASSSDSPHEATTSEPNSAAMTLQRDTIVLSYSSASPPTPSSANSRRRSAANCR